MKVKRYIVDDLPEAVQMIRSELGSDAVILNTKEIRVGGFLGMFRKKRVEVIAAIDEIAKKPPARSPAPTRPAENRTASPPLNPELLKLSDQESSSPLLPSNAIRQRYTQTPFADSGRTPAAVQERVREPMAAGGTSSNPFKTSFEQAVAVQEREADLRDSLTTDARADTQAATLAVAVQALESREARENQPQPTAASAEESSALLQELRSMKEMMAKLSRQQTFRSMPVSVMSLSRRLAEQGVDPIFVEQFAEEVNGALEGAGDVDVVAAYEAGREVLRAWIQGSKGDGIDKATRIVHFVGPTGVGKTTTIAKLAAEQSFNHRRSVGFITADTYRIAAVDQLRTYADILNVPLEVVFSPSELSRAYAKLSDRDLLFMDTAGRNYRNELFVSEVNSLLAPGEHTETILVLSMTHKYSDMKAVASQFAKYGVGQLLLTKFDETDSFGAVVNLVKHFDFRISYYTCGQAVPDDIRPFDPEDLVNRLLGEPGDD